MIIRSNCRQSKCGQSQWLASRAGPKQTSVTSRQITLLAISDCSEPAARISQCVRRWCCPRVVAHTHTLRTSVCGCVSCRCACLEIVLCVLVPQIRRNLCLIHTYNHGLWSGIFVYHLDIYIYILYIQIYIIYIYVGISGYSCIFSIYIAIIHNM